MVADRFIRTLKGKIYKKLTVNGNKSDLGYLNKIADQHNNTDNRSICKNTYWCWLFCFEKRNWIES